MSIDHKFFLDGPFGRLLRTAASLALTAAIAKYQNNAWYISATPLIVATTKAIRDKWPGKFEWLPV